MRNILLASAVSALCAIALPSSAFAFGGLSEFLSKDGNTLRTFTVNSSDIIASPRWLNGSNINFNLCTGGAFDMAPINHNGSKEAELLADINSALSTWSAVAGGPTFAVSIADSTCGPNDGGFDTKANRLSFTNTPPAGVLAYTTINMAASNGVLSITDGRIEFNTNYDPGMGTNEGFSTNACLVCTGGSCQGSCINHSPRLGFLGILVHELGHYLGLSHSLINDENDDDGIDSGATMFPSIRDLQQSREIETLESDDILGKKNLYSPTGFPNFTSEGRISGTVKRANSARTGMRGAHVYAINLNTGRSIGGTFSGMNGSFASTTGSWTIDGIPFNVPFIVVVEPIDRPEAGLSYEAFNTVLTTTFNNQIASLREFFIEGYPDAAVVDIRTTGTLNSSPGVSAASQFTLSAAQPQITGINFYISDDLAPTNDTLATSISFPADSTIANSNPLAISLNAVSSLALLTSPTLTLTAINNSSGQAIDWKAALPTVSSYCGTAMTLCLDPRRISAADGNYTVVFSLTDPTYGTFTASKSIQVSGWTTASCASDLDNNRIVYEESCGEGSAVSGDSGGGGGGCILQAERAQGSQEFVAMFALFWAAGILWLRRKLYARKSFTSFAST